MPRWQLRRGVAQWTGDLLSRYQERERLGALYERAYERYSWPVQRVTDLRLAPFHILATEGAVHVDKDHEWHMQIDRRAFAARRCGKAC